jgi:predicted thioredoxin/glutaredoxin
MRYLITLITLLGTLFAFLMWGFNTANAGEQYNKAVLGHVIQSKVNGTNVDVSKLMESEMQKLAHQFAIESITILQAYLPAILDGIAADLRLKADKEYKCKLLENTKIKDDCK